MMAVVGAFLFISSGKYFSSIPSVGLFDLLQCHANMYVFMESVFDTLCLTVIIHFACFCCQAISVHSAATNAETVKYTFAEWHVALS